ncbi:hypothetical protein ASC90_00235 [Rhizobium sp. Root1220]|nr:hypothetical protein ASC90_00235 [Rhizobium sp. Root1220]
MNTSDSRQSLAACLSVKNSALDVAFSNYVLGDLVSAFNVAFPPHKALEDDVRAENGDNDFACLDFVGRAQSAFD